MNLTYVGTDDRRTIKAEDFSNYEGDFEDLEWVPGLTLEVPDEVGAHLLEFHRNQFRESESVASHHKTHKQLMEEARELGIGGRSNMSKDELVAAIDEHRVELANAEVEDHQEPVLSQDEHDDPPPVVENVQPEYRDPMEDLKE